jgi:hypothetical protein
LVSRIQTNHNRAETDNTTCITCAKIVHRIALVRNSTPCLCSLDDVAEIWFE